MDKPEISKEDGRLKWLCNEAFFGVKRRLPAIIRESEYFDRGLAFGLGFAAGYGVAEVGEELLEFLDVDSEKVAVPCFYATAGAAPISHMIAPRYFRDFIRENPRYSAGAAGVMAGACAKALDHLLL